MGGDRLFRVLRVRAPAPRLPLDDDVHASAAAERHLLLQGGEPGERDDSAHQELPLRGPQLSGGGQHPQHPPHLLVRHQRHSWRAGHLVRLPALGQPVPVRLLGGEDEGERPHRLQQHVIFF